MTTIIDNTFVTLFYHEDRRMVHHIYKKGIGGDYLKEALTVGTDYLIANKASKWLSDNRAIDGVTDEESAWINEVWLPRTMQAGWKFWALVVPQAAHARMNMVQFVNAFREQGVLVRVFTDADAAMTWLDTLTEDDALPALAGDTGSTTD